MLRLRSAHLVSQNTINITVTPETLQTKIEQMNEDAASRMDTFGCHTNLSVDFSSAEGGVLNAEDLSVLVSKAPAALTTLDVKGVQLRGPLASLASSLSTSHSLRSMKWGISLQGYENDDLAVLGEGMVSMKRLDDLTFGPECPVNDKILSKIITPLLQPREDPKAGLSSMTISSFTERRGSQEVSDFFSAWQASVTLSRVDIRGSPPVDRISDVLRNSVSLTSLRVHCTDEDAEQEANLICLAEALKCNNLLRSISFHSYNRHGGEGWENRVAAAFVEAMSKHNYTLRYFYMTMHVGHDGLPWNLLLPLYLENRVEYYVDVDFYVDLNRIGRAKLMGTPSQRKTAPAEDWFDALSKADDVAVIYYLLKENMTLFPGRLSAVDKSRKAMQKRKTKNLLHDPLTAKRSKISLLEDSSISMASPTGTVAVDLFVHTTTTALDGLSTLLEQDPNGISAEQRTNIEASIQRLWTTMKK